MWLEVGGPLFELSAVQAVVFVDDLPVPEPWRYPTDAIARRDDVMLYEVLGRVNVGPVLLLLSDPTLLWLTRHLSVDRRWQAQWCFR